MIIMILTLDERYDMHKQMIQHLQVTLARTEARADVLKKQLASARQMQADWEAKQAQLPLVPPVKAGK